MAILKGKSLQKILELVFFLAIVILASVLRLKNLSTNPPGFYTDEASIGYNAYQILKTGHDEHQKFLPVFFEAFGDYKNPLAVYPTVATIAIFGPNELAVRLPQAIFGILSVIAIYFLAKELFNPPTAIIAALTLATVPWSVHLSRFHIESHNAFILTIILGTYFFLKSIRHNFARAPLLLSTVLFGLSFYTYYATRIFTPLYLIGLAVIFNQDLRKIAKSHPKRLLLSVLTFSVIIVPFINHLASGQGFARFQQVSLLNKDHAVTQSVDLFLAHLTPKFVFFTGDSDYPGQTIVRHSLTGIGLLYKWQLPFFILGLIFLLSKLSRQTSIIILILLLYPLGTVVSDAQTPYATRSVIGIIPYVLITSFGIYSAFVFLKQPILKVALAASIFVLFIFFFQRFLNLEKAYANRAYGYPGFQYGAKQIVQYFLVNQDKYSSEIIYGGFDGPEAYINFFGLDQCFKCLTQDPDPQDQNRKLFAVPVDETQTFLKKYQSAALKDKIYYPDNREAFYLYEVKYKSM